MKLEFKELEKLKAENKKLKEALKKACEGSTIFEMFADCKRDSWVCNCQFCKDVTSSKKLREARQTLKEIEEMK